MDAILDAFYEFHAERVVSRPGQPLATKPGIEIGPRITREIALQYAKAGRDVYTLAKEDAYRLAVLVSPCKPVSEAPHHPPQPSPTGRMGFFSTLPSWGRPRPFRPHLLW
jgi:hypothetical protein